MAPHGRSDRRTHQRPCYCLAQPAAFAFGAPVSLGVPVAIGLAVTVSDALLLARVVVILVGLLEWYASLKRVDGRSNAPNSPR